MKIENAIVSTLNSVAELVEGGHLESQILADVIDQICEKHGTEFVAGIMMKMPNVNKIDELLKGVA